MGVFLLHIDQTVCCRFESLSFPFNEEKVAQSGRATVVLQKTQKYPCFKIQRMGGKVSHWPHKPVKDSSILSSATTDFMSKYNNRLIDLYHTNSEPVNLLFYFP